MNYSIKKLQNFDQDFCYYLFEFLKKEASGVIAMGGGNTPKKIHQVLLKQFPINELSQNLSKFQIIASDERHVPYDHPDNNCMMLEKTLLEPLKINSLKKFEFMPNFSEYLATNQAKFKGISPPLLSILGIGSDGHTASLFPGQFDSAKTTTLINAGIGPEGHKRISFSLKYLLSSKNIWFLCNSIDKYKALMDNQENFHSPLSSLLKGNTTVFIN